MILFKALHIELNSSLNLAGTEASGANINTLRRAVYNRFDTLNIGLERLIAATMRMGYLNTKGNTLAAYFTFCHDEHLLVYANIIVT